MKIAICLSGQPRTWEKCYHTWLKLIDTIKLNYQVEKVDIFCHFWDFNTPPHRLLMHEGWDYATIPGETISEEEKVRLIRALNPTKYLFENELSNKNKIKETLNRNIAHINEHGQTNIEWLSGQFYGIMYACHLKKMYEYENNFRYDVCIRMRSDIYFDDDQIKYFVGDDLVHPKVNTLYSCHTRKDDIQFPFHRLGDIFWYADTVTFNRICEFYRWLPIIGKRSFNKNLIGPEHSLYFYSKMFNIEISPLLFDPKIYRSEDYLNRKIKSGLEGELGGHELI